jgi:hypothetical protein
VTPRAWESAARLSSDDNCRNIAIGRLSGTKCPVSRVLSEIARFNSWPTSGATLERKIRCRVSV